MGYDSTEMWNWHYVVALIYIMHFKKGEIHKGKGEKERYTHLN